MAPGIIEIGSTQGKRALMVHVLTPAFDQIVKSLPPSQLLVVGKSA